ncbi:MAG: hypothetical protein M3151_08875 [Actinomycetota bacterium]|nr:hypothetical protein [Actinomycetota bacterium]
MSPVPEDQTLAPWRGLSESLAGSFSARALGLLAADFVLLDQEEGREIGRLRVYGSEGAELVAGDLRASIERTAPLRYAMLAGGARVLSAETAGAPGALRIRRAEHVYETRLTLLRNTAEALSPAGERAARVAGGLTNRRYEVAFDAHDAGSLPVAVFLLYRLVALRRGAYRAESGV